MDGQNPFRTTWKPCATILRWCLQGKSSSLGGAGFRPSTVWFSTMVGFFGGKFRGFSMVRFFGVVCNLEWFPWKVSNLKATQNHMPTPFRNSSDMLTSAISDSFP